MMAVLQNLSNTVFGTNKTMRQAPIYNQPQQNAFNSVLGMGLEGLQNPYKGFEGIENRARSQFQNSTIPSIAERFTSMGNNSLSSPNFAQQLGQSAGDFESQLAALRSQYGQQNISQFMNMLGVGLTPQNNYYEEAGQPGLLGQIAPYIGKGLATGAGAYLTGGASAILPALAMLLSGLGGGGGQQQYGGMQQGGMQQQYMPNQNMYGGR
jgi:hypothetical protein